MKNEMLDIKNKILNFYCFKENEDGELYCVLRDRSIIVFRFFPKGTTVDFLLRKAMPIKEESLVLSFSFDDKNHIKTLNEWYSKKLNNKY